MRGMLLLALGAILIWVGVSTAPPSTPEDGTDEVAGPKLAPAAQAAGDEERLEQATPTPEHEAEVVSHEPQPATIRHEPEHEVDPDPAPDSDVSEVLENDLGERAPSVPPPARLESVEDEPTFRLGGPLGDRGEAAEVLLGAWIREDPSGLEAYLNDGAGRELPATRRRLIVTFWQAMVGGGGDGEDVVTELEGADDVTTAQLGFLRASVAVDGGSQARAVPADIGRRDPLARAMRMVLLDRRAEDARRAGMHGEAARCYSDLLQLEIDAPWSPHRDFLLAWARSANEVQENHRLDPRGEWPSISYEVQPNESLISIRKTISREHPGLRVCAGLLRKANRVGKYIHPGDTLKIPTETPNVLVDLDSRIALYRHGDEVVQAWEVGIGKEGHDTPIGTFLVGEKQTEPSWMPQGGPSLPYGHPDNPLGTRWIAWFRDGEKTSFGFHGTADPASVGQRVSQGCIRMRNEQVEVLYDLIPLGARVVVQP
ncbi:MAG: L,D-transpeptidase [bacterium]|nr:L,D-transpeptidase [bacterium]